ncbi:D-amino-acid transaminase [Bacillus seohaeanensis]|jgi:D-alanine transaminase|uniref:D-alanine aminotransferase n=1 Tax=Bacillus seohaeanensis TaxID=284580 RepID=A0ABW5RT50_9BACI
MNTVFLNGQLVDRGEAKVDIEDRGYQFGDGIYEVIRIYNGEPFTMKEHMDRLYESANKIQIDIPFSKQEFTEKLIELAILNKVNDGIIYLQITRGTSARQHHFPAPEVKGNIVAYTKEMARPVSKMDEGVTAKLVEDVRWLRCDIKSLNLLGNLLAKQEAAAEGHFEAILHRGETVTEGSSSNVFIVKDKVIYTHPPTNLILNGITRKVIQKVCQENNITFIEEAFSIAQLQAADEVFMASTTSEVMPIIKVDDKVYGEGKIGPVTKKLQSLFQMQMES